MRHLVSLRKLKRDHGWIHTLLEEAENERMHLMTFMKVANPGIIMKSCIIMAQGKLANKDYNYLFRLTRVKWFKTRVCNSWHAKSNICTL